MAIPLNAGCCNAALLTCVSVCWIRLTFEDVDQARTLFTFTVAKRLRRIATSVYTGGFRVSRVSRYARPLPTRRHFIHNVYRHHHCHLNHCRQLSEIDLTI